MDHRERSRAADTSASIPVLPPLPALDDLSLTDSFASTSVWATSASLVAPVLIPSTTSPPRRTTLSPVSIYSSNNEGVAPNLSDLDPYAPLSPSADSSSPGSTSKNLPILLPIPTLGSTVLPHSRLELISDSDASLSPETSPTTVTHRKLPSPPPPEDSSDSPDIPSRGRRDSGQISEGTGGGNGFMSLFRAGASLGEASINAVKVAAKAVTDAEDEKASLRNELTEKQVRVASGSGSGLTTPPFASTSTLANPLASFASAFRSATSSISSQAGTPPAKSSPAVGEKGAYMEAARTKDGRGKEKAVDREKAQDDAEATFDFNKFLEQMRARSADPIAKYLRSFLKEFSRRPPVSSFDQTRVINDFLDFIAGKMRGVDPWRSMLAESDSERGEIEFDMAMEAMEKLVMNRVWHLTFTPAIDLKVFPGHISPTDDLERDHVLGQRIQLFAWILPCHLDLPVNPPAPTSPPASQPMSPASSRETIESPNSQKVESSDAKEKQKQRQAQGFLDFARRELLKINQYKAPRDKLICILNSCKVIFGLIRHLSSDEGADAFIPFLIFIVLKANPEHLVSNLQYIQRFRNPEKLSGEGGYYLSSLNGAISFIETMDASSLSNITQAEFENHVEQAILSLPMDPADSTMRIPTGPIKTTGTSTPEPAHSTSADLIKATDVESPTSLLQPGISFPDVTKAFFQRSTDSVERIVSKPLDAIGRIFDQFENENIPLPPPVRSNSNSSSLRHSRRNPKSYPGSQPRSDSLSYQQDLRNNQSDGRAVDPYAGLYVSDSMSADQVSTEIERHHEEQRLAALETLQGMFPQLEREVLEMVLLSNDGDMSKSIDSLLEMS